ncbi:MAG: hypothetical protein M1831_000378 [Alyxoria varia]|nr:MAG: hypothetical protein M1831_000378 [Alyxoria varia]
MLTARSIFADAAAIFVVAVAAQQGPYNPYTSIKDDNQHTQPIYSPARPPAIPLAVRSPYTSAWSTVDGNNTLNSNGASFWQQDPLGWEGIISVDGISYEWLGIGSQTLPQLPNLMTAVPLSVSYDSSYSNFTFACGPVELTAEFLSPVEPRDLCRTSIPLSYLSVSARSTDSNSHNVTLYTDVDGSWTGNDSDATLAWNLYAGGAPVNASNATTSGPSDPYSWVISLDKQYEFSEGNQFALWGNFTFSTSRGPDQAPVRYASGKDVDVRFNFTQGVPLSNLQDSNYRGWGNMNPIFAYSHDLGQVGGEPSQPVLYTIGTVQQPAVRYLTRDGIQSLRPWWATCGYGDLFGLIRFHYNDYPTAQQQAAGFETRLKREVARYYSEDAENIYSQAEAKPPPSYFNGTQEDQPIANTDQFGQQYIFDSSTAYGFLSPNHTCYATGRAIPEVSEAQSYYSIVALAARQVMGAYVLAENPYDEESPLMFQKEISSNGNINTADVIFPAFPYFLYTNPEMLRYTLEPIFQYQEAGFWPAQYALHDLGTHYPNVTGHPDGEAEYMPLEESGNMIIMSLAYHRFANRVDYLRQHYDTLKQWASYLIEFALIPTTQLSTDDFAGQLANQSNLAIKGIVGLQAMSEISRLVGDDALADNYSAYARDYYTRWEYLAIDPSEQHTLLAYQWRSSWGLLYNAYPDKLLQLGVIPQRLYDMQSAWYPKVSQIFGVPLDSRHAYTKSDWEMWTAATCSPETRRLFVDGLAYWLNNTDATVPFSDLFYTTGNGSYPQNPDLILFEARPVQGGLYSLLALITDMVGMD